MVSTASDTEEAALATSSDEDATPFAASVTLSTLSANFLSQHFYNQLLYYYKRN